MVLFLRFRLQFVLLRMGAEQLHQAAAAAARAERPRHSRPAEKFVLVASDINIFGTLPSWQGKLFVRPTNPGERLGFFWFWFGPLADGTAGMAMTMMVMMMARAAVASGTGRVLYRFEQSSSFRNRHQWQQRWQCCHVLTRGASPVETVAVCRSDAILPARRLRRQSSG